MIRTFKDIPSVDLTLFGNTTEDSGLTAEMKTFYDDTLIQLAEPELVHNQFGQKKPIPANRGKKIEFREYSALPELSEFPLTEGVTPSGQSLTVSTVEADILQYGGYVEISDLLELTAIDDNIVQAARLIASQAGRTLDTVTREILTAGTNKIYGDGTVTSRGAITTAMKLTVDLVRRGVTYLKRQNAPRIGGYYIGIVHPDVAYDLMSDPQWINAKTYSDVEDLYAGELGRIAGVRFVESSEAKMFTGAGAGGQDIYATMLLGADAYGVTEVSGGGLEMIIKQLGSGGAADPLDQRATVGWKATAAAERLVEQYMIRLETSSSI